MIVIIDHFDSFSETLARYVREAGVACRVVRQDAANVEAITALAPQGIILSPGPGRPETTGITLPLIAALGGRLPMLGICLGHQAIAQAYGGTLARASTPRHGKATHITHKGGALYDGIDSPFEVGLYHALIVESLPEILTATAHDGTGAVMGLAHRTQPIYGVQFHPESILTPDGRRLIGNFLALAGIT